MFSGIIEKKAPIASVAQGPADRIKMTIDSGYSDLALGESVAVDGVCLTVEGFEGARERGLASFFVSEETLARTRFRGIEKGATVNLERALKVSDRLSGHIVQGHVDGIAKVKSISASNEGLKIDLELDATLARYCVEKGSITINGVSLTINAMKSGNVSASGARSEIISLWIIPHTSQVTTLGTLKANDSVHVEVDVLAKYVERLCQHRSN